MKKMRKLLAVVVICLAVLLGAIGAYSYVEIVGLRSDVDSLHETVSSLETYVSSLENETNQLQSEVSTLENQIDALQDELAHKNSTTTLKFFWDDPFAEYFNASTFWMNITLEKITTDKIWYPTGENITRVIITVELNDLRDEDWKYSYLGIASGLTGSWAYRTYPIKEMRFLGNYSESCMRFMTIIPLLFFDEESDHEFYHNEYGVKYVVQSEPLQLLFDMGLTNVAWVHIEYELKVAVEFCYELEMVP